MTAAEPTSSAAEYQALLGRVCDAASLLPPAQAEDARRVVELSRQFLAALPAGLDADVRTLRRELQRLAELLGRRSSSALPAAALARALLSELAGDGREAASLRRDCDAKLLMLGF